MEWKYLQLEVYEWHVSEDARLKGRTLKTLAFWCGLLEILPSLNEVQPYFGKVHLNTPLSDRWYLWHILSGKWKQREKPIFWVVTEYVCYISFEFRVKTDFLWCLNVRKLFINDIGQLTTLWRFLKSRDIKLCGITLNMVKTWHKRINLHNFVDGLVQSSRCSGCMHVHTPIFSNLLTLRLSDYLTIKKPRLIKQLSSLR